MIIEFFVPGVPAPGGSKKAHLIPKRGGGFVTRANGSPIIAVRDMGGEKTNNWRSVVACAANQAFKGDPLDGPLDLEVTFHMPRPTGHYGSGRNAGVLKPTAPTHHTSQPDATKLLRSTEDALTGLLWKDDARICWQNVAKVYANGRTGASIRVSVAKPRPVLDLSPKLDAIPLHTTEHSSMIGTSPQTGGLYAD